MTSGEFMSVISTRQVSQALVGFLHRTVSVWAGRLVVVRMTEFRLLMETHFGPQRAPSIAQDHVFGALSGLTANQALRSGFDARDVWFAVCDDFEIPDNLRWGLPD